VLQPAARHADRLGVVSRLAVLLGELREQPRAGIAVEPAAQFVDAGVHHGRKASGPARVRPAPLSGLYEDAP